MVHRVVRTKARKPIPLGVVPIHIRIADVDVLLGAKFGPDPIEMVLQHRERDGNAVLLPHALLAADRPVGAASSR